MSFDERMMGVLIVNAVWIAGALTLGILGFRKRDLP